MRQFYVIAYLRNGTSTRFYLNGVGEGPLTDEALFLVTEDMGLEAVGFDFVEVNSPAIFILV